MLFNTAAYGLFLCLTLAVYGCLRRARRARIAFLLGASYFFYGCWKVEFLALIVFSTVLDYCVGAALHRSRDPRRRRWLLTASLAGNLGVLAVFKYYDFFVTEAVELLALLGVRASPPLLEVALPVGISFYTFQTLSYTLDIHRGRLVPCRRFLDFALFVAFFPQLVAGPIVRAVDFLPQLADEPRVDDERLGEALAQILRGLFKKVVIADFLAVRLVDPVFGDPQAFGAVDTLLAVYGYAFQIYGDFSGYSDIAIGSAALLGFRLPVNFRSPYRATDLRDFWRRWHISLSTWLRDYLYIPLGGSKRGPGRTQVNLLATMVLGGLWHGAAWTFVAWGALHGGGLALTRVLQRRSRAAAAPGRLRRVVAVVATFHVVCAGWVFFRATDFAVAADVFAALVRFDEPSRLALPGVLGVLGLAALTHYAPDGLKLRSYAAFTRWPAAAQACLLVALLALFQNAKQLTVPFIYFQF